MANLHELRPDSRVVSPDFGVPKAKGATRHVGLAASALVVVGLPIFLTAIYLFGFAADRFVTQAGFSIRREEHIAPPDILSGLTSLGGGGDTDAALVRDFLRSPDLVGRLNSRIPLTDLLSPPAFDPLFPDAGETSEALMRRWNRLVHVSLDSRSGLINVELSAFSPDAAAALIHALIDEAAAMIARLSDQMRQEATMLARAEISLAEARLTKAQTALTQLRADTRVVDPTADLEGRLGLVTSLQAQLSEAQIALGLLRQTTNNADPRLTAAQNRVEIIEALIEDERAKFGHSAAGYAKLTTAFEAQTLEVEYARESYIAARAALDLALATAQKRSRFLAVHIQPTQPEMPVKPKRWTIIISVAFISGLTWAMIFLGVYSSRGRL